MKKIFFKSIAIAITTSLFCTTSLSAQGFLNKLKKATDKVESVSKTVESVTGATTASTEQGTDSISPKEFLEKAPSYTVKKVIETDSLGKAITNEDGTTRYSYLLIDKDGKVCEKNAVRKHLNSALKSGTFILLKVGGGATAGALAGKKIGGSKKSAWIGAGVGAAAGLLGSANDIKAVKQQIKLMKECKKVLKAYEKTFTEEGTPIDASIDLANVDGINFTECEEITKSAADVKNEFLASKTAGESLEEIEMPDTL
ncbi:hypothetical protein QR305_03914 [Bacteroides finegoldii]|mgnify:CR=1 FL=1|jgi:hypothetical protein|uniref:Glycine zipper domain-containing protein n=1 Tax=Bacteroides finegoldii CL09T03C10 TaxID=997888 RepID=K5D8X6_9BACE|nr:hypothetical protein [Bacteroides finegoldii]EKJ89398.1 hypothetical protein HMPREF1057_02939 [Bacteroides finegoldii CL09T03C10]